MKQGRRDEGLRYMEGEEELNERNNKKKNDKNPTIYECKAKSRGYKDTGKREEMKGTEFACVGNFLSREKNAFH